MNTISDSTQLEVRTLNQAPALHSHRVDEETSAIVLELLAPHVVLLQALLELYEGLATMRTIIPRESVVALFVPHSMVNHCAEMLLSVTDKISWRSREVLGEQEINALTTE